jgi:hypothetical protein
MHAQVSEELLRVDLEEVLGRLDFFLDTCRTSTDAAWIVRLLKFLVRDKSTFSSDELLELLQRCPSAPFLCFLIARYECTIDESEMQLLSDFLSIRSRAWRWLHTETFRFQDLVSSRHIADRNMPVDLRCTSSTHVRRLRALVAPISQLEFFTEFWPHKVHYSSASGSDAFDFVMDFHLRESSVFN